MSGKIVTTSPPLKIEDLMERWSVSVETVKEHIRKNGLPFWDAGTGRGQRPDYRFRLADVEVWEAARVRVKEPPAVGSVPMPTVAAPMGWDGKIRGTGGKAGRRRG